MQRPALFDEVDAALAAIVPPETVHFGGDWLPSARRTYESVGQTGTGSGPYVEVVDLRWRGTVSCSTPLAGIAFLVTASDIFWVKSAPAAVTHAVEVSFHAYADYSATQATLVGRQRLWRVRDHVAATLPPGVRELLTRRRSGRIPRGASSAHSEPPA